jgi:aminotransferase
MISVFGSDITQAEIEAASRVMESQWMGFGRLVEQFETEFAAVRQLPDVAMVDSGSNALFMAVTLLDLPPGSDVIVPSFTWVSCAQAVLMAGHRPVFCDVDLETMNVRRDDVERVLTPRTAAIMVVHYAGLAVEMDAILELGLPVIEDAAHAVDTQYRGKPAGGIGDVGIFSFDAVKNLAVGEGGAVAAKDPESLVRARQLRYCGIGKSGFDAAVSSAAGRSRWWEYTINEPFIKMLPTNVAAAIGRIQLERLPDLQSRRRGIWEHYDAEFSTVSALTRPRREAVGDTHSFFTYCITVPNRDDLAHHLLKRGIYTTLRYHPLHLNPLYGQTDVRLPNCEQLNETALSLPLHPRLTDDDVTLIVDEVRRFLQ